MQPALWLSQTDIFIVSSEDGDLVYLKFIALEIGEKDKMSITVEVGTEQSSYEMVLEVKRGQSGPGQTNYTKIEVRMAYQYKQYMSCKNNIQSKSQNFGSLIIKTCNY